MISPGRLVLFLSGLLVAAPALSSGAPGAPENGGPRNWRVSGATTAVHLREQPSRTSRSLARLAPGTILDNLGCQSSGSGIWCDVQRLGGGPRGYVAADYLKPAVSPDGSVAVGPDDSALRAGQAGSTPPGRSPVPSMLASPRPSASSGCRVPVGATPRSSSPGPMGRTRAIFFRMGIPVGANSSQADGYGQFKAGKEADLNLIRVGDERYEIPDAAVLVGDGCAAATSTVPHPALITATTSPARAGFAGLPTPSPRSTISLSPGPGWTRNFSP